MTTIEGWPYVNHPKRGKDLQTRYNRADATLKRAEARMRRAFNAWQKAREAFNRTVKRLEKETE